MWLIINYDVMTRIEFESWVRVQNSADAFYTEKNKQKKKHKQMHVEQIWQDGHW